MKGNGALGLNFFFIEKPSLWKWRRLAGLDARPARNTKSVPRIWLEMAMTSRPSSDGMEMVMAAVQATHIDVRNTCDASE